MKKKLTIKQAILKVMYELDRPITSKEAYYAILERNLYEFHTQNPLGVVNAQIRRSCIGIDFPSSHTNKLFAKDNYGKFYPIPKSQKTSKQNNDSLPQLINELKGLHDQHTKVFKKRVLDELKRIPPDAFELFTKRLLECYGFKEMNVTQISKDGGIDGYGKLKVGIADMNVAFQCKRWTSSNIGRPDIDKFRGAIQGEFEQGMFFTTASFTKSATNVSFKPGAVPIILIDGTSITNLMIDKKFGIEEEQVKLYSYNLDSILDPDYENDLDI